MQAAATYSATLARHSSGVPEAVITWPMSSGITLDASTICSWMAGWTRELGTWRAVPAGESQHWEGNLEPGIHFMVCAHTAPLLVWFGTGLTVED